MHLHRLFLTIASRSLKRDHAVKSGAIRNDQNAAQPNRSHFGRDDDEVESMTRNRCCTDVSRTMDKIDVPADEVVPLDAIATGVVGLRILFVNVFAVQGPVGWTLIDGGLAGTANRIE